MTDSLAGTLLFCGHHQLIVASAAEMMMLKHAVRINAEIIHSLSCSYIAGRWSHCRSDGHAMRLLGQLWQWRVTFMCAGASTLPTLWHRLFRLIWCADARRQ